MSDTKFGKNIDQIENRVGDATDDDFEPAVPAVPDKPEPTHTCAACYAPIWLTPDGWRSRLDYKCSSSGEDSGGHRPAVPDKVAPPEPRVGDHVVGVIGPIKIRPGNTKYAAPCGCKCISCRGGRCVECREHWKEKHPIPAEPQAGAQVPSRDERFTIRWSTVVNEYKVSIPNYDGGEVVKAEEYDRIVAHLAIIRSYVEEAAKTPITREDMHDAMKAQTYYDEANGLYRLILSETGDGK
jgi:hypothetical protein